MHRRTAALVVLVAALALMLPTAAIAASASLRGPAGGVVTGPTSLDVRVSREAFEAISAIDVGLRRGGAAVEGSRTQRLCEGIRDCPNSERTADYRVPFDPRTGSPFLPDGAGRILPNGTYELRVSIEVGRSTDERALGLTLSVPPTSPSDVRASASGQQVTVQWRGAPEPDISGYRVERSANRGNWSSVGNLAPSATTFAHEPGPGSYRYRVVALRPDGKGGTYEATSSEAEVRVSEPPAPEPSERAPREGDSSSGDGNGDGDGGGTDTDDGNGSGGDVRSGDDQDERTPTDDETEASTGASASSGNGSGSGRSAPPRRSSAQAPTFRAGTASTPSLPWDDPEYFQEALDYDAPETAERRERAPSDDEAGEVLLSVPGMGPRGGGVDGSQAAVPIAGGLLMTAMGLHLWRWLKLA